MAGANGAPGAAPAASGGSRAAEVAVVLCLVALAAAVSLQQIRSLDYWWLLRTGALIAESGEVPRVDPYTISAPGSRWLDVHWLHQLGLFGLYELGGHAAVVFGKLVFALGIVACLAPIGYRRRRPAVTGLALGLALLVAGDRFMPRPELSTFLLLSLELFLFDRFARRGGLLVYAVVAVQLVWVNLHGLFAVGLVVCAIQCAGELLRPLRGEGLRRARLAHLVAVAVLSALVSLANPNGLDTLLYPVQQLGMIDSEAAQRTFGAISAELISPFDPRGLRNPLAARLALGLALSSLAALVANWRRVAFEDVLLWLAFAYLAGTAQRNVALFALVAAPLLVRNLNAVLDARARSADASDPTGRPLVSFGAAIVLAAMAYDVGSGRFFPRVGALRAPGLSVLETFHPVAAVDWVERERPRGPIFHFLEDGGYLIWRLAGSYPVLVDGRLEVFGPEKLRALRPSDAETFRELDAKYRFGTALVRYVYEAGAVIPHLVAAPDWRLVFVGEQAMVFVRARPGEPFPHREVDAREGALFEPLPDPPNEARVRDFSRRLGRTRAYRALGRADAARLAWEDTVRRYPDLSGGGASQAGK